MWLVVVVINFPKISQSSPAKKEKKELASKHDIFINTTHFDNTPVSVMEAMALGLPVISTNVGVIPFLLTNEQNAF